MKRWPRDLLSCGYDITSSVKGPGTPGKAYVQCGEAVVGRNDPPFLDGHGEISDSVEQLQKRSGAIHMAWVNTLCGWSDPGVSTLICPIDLHSICGFAIFTGRTLFCGTAKHR